MSSETSSDFSISNGRFSVQSPSTSTLSGTTSILPVGMLGLTLLRRRTVPSTASVLSLLTARTFCKVSASSTTTWVIP